MMLRVLRVCVVMAALLGAAGPAWGGRAVISLEGKWNFRLDPRDVGRSEQWFSAAVPFTNTIQVPGAWQAQGYGEDGPKLRHNYEGKAWYKRQVRLPKAQPGQRLFLRIGAVHRSAEVWFNGSYLGEHIGYLSAFEFELPASAAGTTATVAVCVDCKQHWERDCLTGCLDLIDEMFTPWGGIWGHVSVEARHAAWLEEAFVQPANSPPRCTVTARLAGSEAAESARLTVRKTGKDGFYHAQSFVQEYSLGQGSPAFSKDKSELRLEMEMPGARLWSPEAPNLYTARVELMKEGVVVDRVEVPFGLREIRIEGHDFYLNGKKLFLRGYGDDCIYPETMAPPLDKNFYRRKLQAAKDYGFNFVRHHSTFLPAEYYAAADEVGMLVSPELPIAYQEYYAKAAGPALELYQTEWAAAIKQLRNHPSILDWCMGNELYYSTPIAPELYRTAKRLDPTRPVLDSDGLPGHFLPQGMNRDTLDFFSVQFEEHALPPDIPGKHRLAAAPPKPVLSHETGNYITVPRLDLIEQFRDNFKPFWLTPFRAKLEKLGLTDEAKQWSLNSEQLYCLAHKLNLEDLRKNSWLAGYEWWLLQDYWTGANGLFDHYFRPKSVRAATVRQFNAPTVLLLEGLPITCSSPRPLKLKLLVSNYSPEPIRNGRVRWTARLGKQVLANNRPLRFQAGQGELAEAGTIAVEMPPVSRPEKLVVKAELKGGVENSKNEWSAWVYPEPEPARAADAGRVPVFANHELLSQLEPFGARLLPADGPLPTQAVYVVTQPNARVLGAVEAGASIICLSPIGLFPSVPNRFKPAWWLGNANDCNAGTVVYPNPVTRDIAPEGWCDLGWYRLLEGAQAFVLDEVPFVTSDSRKLSGAGTASSPGSSSARLHHGDEAVPAPARPRPVLVRSLDVHTVCRDKALLFEARVGRGSMLVSGLRLESLAEAPERAWLLNRLLEYAATFPQPKAALPVAFLRARAEQFSLPEGPFVSGFARLLTEGAERTDYPSCRETQAPIYVYRQLESGRSLEWETAPVPSDAKGSQVTFAFAGGLGWISQPKGEGFTLFLNGNELLSFDISHTSQAWSGQNTKLCFVVRKSLPEDALGLFYLTVPADLVKRGEPCRLTVRSKAKDSRRWFGLNPYSDLGTK